VGINIFAQLANDPDWRVRMRGPIEYGHFMGLDPLRVAAILKACDISNKLTDYSQGVLIDPIGNDLEAHYEPAELTIGRVVVEKHIKQAAFEKLSHFDALLTGSTWNKQILEEVTDKPVKVILEGIDPSLFMPGPKSGWLPEGFYVLSVGKLEHRKGQDIVMLAFKAFSERHPEARLVTCWQSTWNSIGNGYTGNTGVPLWLDDSGRLKVKQWAVDIGIDPDKVYDLNSCPNFLMPQIYRECDVLLAPSRVESCTSLPVKEAMACGLPVIAALHTGMHDVLTPWNSYLLLHNKILSAPNTPYFPKDYTEWYEPDVEECIERLESVYRTRLPNTDGSEWVRKERTWKRHTEELKVWIMSLS
jgi:glycosyltransferase involved in cell wall biosynthesis